MVLKLPSKLLLLFCFFYYLIGHNAKYHYFLTSSPRLLKKIKWDQMGNTRNLIIALKSTFMRSLLILSILLFFRLSSIAQVTGNVSVVDKIKSESNYIIGIGNQEATMYFDVLHNLQNNTTIKVYAICETHRVIGIIVQDSVYKSYDEVSNHLLGEYPTLLLFRKDDTIFTLDCKEEILKQ